MTSALIFMILLVNSKANFTEVFETMFPEGSSWEENSLCMNFGLENSPSTPTPPQSPESKADATLGYETFSNVEMVNPNAVLDESYLFSDSTRLNFNFPCLNSSEVSLKRESWNPFLSKDLLDYFSTHDFVKNSCNKCFTDSMQSEVLNDCMWTSGCENIKLDRLSISSETNYVGSTKSSISKPHLDSVSSKYSEIMDPLSGMIANINSDDLSSHPEPVLDTPSDTSDADTDLEDTCNAAENIHLEHNYHFTNSSISPDFASSFRKKSHNEQTTKDHHINSTDCSDDEITIDEDSENSDSRSDTSQNCMQIANHNFLTLNSSKGNLIVNTDSNATDLQIFGKVERKTYIPRKVGRPSKNLKRVGASFPNIKRSGGGCRSIQMDPERRRVHNSMERMRRVNLKSDFDHIRELVPSLIDRVRAPKVLILKSAVEFVYELSDEIQKMNIEMLRLSHYNCLLKQKFKELKKERGITDIELG